MRYFQDTVLLILYCLFAVQYTEVDLYFILGFLVTVIICCVSFHLSGEIPPEGYPANIWYVLCLADLAASWFLPPFLFFLPVITYTLLRKHQYLLTLCGICLYLYRIGSTSSDAPFLCLLLFGLFGFLLSYLMQNHTECYEDLDSEYRRTQDDSRERNLLLSEKNKSLQEKQDYEIYTATLKERNRIAREIHDNVGHVLSRSILLLGAVKTVNKETSLEPLLENLDNSLNQAMDSIRSSVHDLHDESINLKEAIQSLINDFTFCPVELLYDMEPGIPREVKYCFISITKEALSNIMKHSSASKARITMREHPAIYQLCIEDNGKNISTSVQLPLKETGRIPSAFESSGIGIKNMKDRVKVLNGIFQITTDFGFRIFITIPK